MVAKGLEGALGLISSSLHLIEGFVSMSLRNSLAQTVPVRVRDRRDVLGSVSNFGVCQMEEPHFVNSDGDCGDEDPGLGWGNSWRAKDRPLSATCEACNAT